MKKHAALPLIALFFTYLANALPLKNIDSELPNYTIGDAIVDFNLKSTDGRIISMANFASAKGFIIVFTSNHCPFSKAYEDRIIALNDMFSGKGYPVIAINPNDSDTYEEDSFIQMQRVANEKKYRFPYCYDTNQLVSKIFGVLRTPQVFIIKKENNKNILEYIGAIDDNALDASNVSKRYVEDATNNLIVGKPIIPNTTKAIGCAIKWK